VIGSAFLDGRDRYERVFEGRIDNTHPDALTHTARLADDDGEIELAAVVTPSPEYGIREAQMAIASGAIDPSLPDAVRTLAGARMIGGFTRRVREAVGERRGGALVVDAAIEIARLARQVAKLPAERARTAAGDPRACWELDTQGWVDLPNSCFTYSDPGPSPSGCGRSTTRRRRGCPACSGGARSRGSSAWARAWLSGTPCTMTYTASRSRTRSMPTVGGS
jgi:hypothetical protein